MARSGDQIIREDSEIVVMLRALIAVLENRLSTRRLTISSAELEVIRGKRGIRVKPSIDGIVLEVYTAEEMAKMEAEARVPKIGTPTVTVASEDA